LACFPSLDAINQIGNPDAIIPVFWFNLPFFQAGNVNKFFRFFLSLKGIGSRIFRIRLILPVHNYVLAPQALSVIKILLNKQNEIGKDVYALLWHI
jgi:hypothetical protein